MTLIKKITRRKNDILRALKLKILLFKYKLKPQVNRLNPEKISHVLILRLDDKIGDMIVATGLIKALHDNNIKVSVLTGPVCQALLSTSNLIDQCFLYKRRGDLLNVKAQNIDLVVDFDDVVTFERCKLISQFNQAHVMGFNKINYPMYHTSLAHLDEKNHITERHKLVSSYIGLPSYKYKYYLPECQDSKGKVSELVNNICFSRIVAINPLTGAEDKDLSAKQTQGIVDHIKGIDESIVIILIGQPSKIIPLGIKNVMVIPDSTINTASEIIRRCDIVISPDTSIVHMANMFNKPLLAFYNRRKLKDTGLPGWNLWSPNYPNGKQVVFDDASISEVSISRITPLIDEILKPHK